MHFQFLSYSIMSCSAWCHLERLPPKPRLGALPRCSHCPLHFRRHTAARVSSLRLHCTAPQSRPEANTARWISAPSTGNLRSICWDWWLPPRTFTLLLLWQHCPHSPTTSPISFSLDVVGPSLFFLTPHPLWDAINTSSFNRDYCRPGRVWFFSSKWQKIL